LPYSDLVEAEKKQEVRDFVDRVLDEFDALLVDLRFYQDMKLKDIAKVVGISYQAIQVRLRSIIVRLRNEVSAVA